MRRAGKHTEPLHHPAAQTTGALLRGPHRTREESAQNLRVPRAPEAADAREARGGMGAHQSTACTGGLRERVRRVQSPAGEGNSAKERSENAAKRSAQQRNRPFAGAKSQSKCALCSYSPKSPRSTTNPDPDPHDSHATSAYSTPTLN